MSEQIFYPEEKEAKYHIFASGEMAVTTTTLDAVWKNFQTSKNFGFKISDVINVKNLSHDFSIKTNNQGLWVMEIKSLDNNELLEDKLTRMEIWNNLFGDMDVPKPEDDAVTKYAGSLVTGEGFSDEEILEALNDD